MVNATVDNDPVSIQLDAGESTTVPTGEVWRVYNLHDLGGQTNGQMQINGTIVQTGERIRTSQTVLIGGDTIEHGAGSSGTGIHIGGFVVSQ